MALSLQTLKTEFRKLMDPNDPAFVGYPSDPTACADAFANAYDIYCQSAQDIIGNKVLTANKAGFASSLLSLPPVGTPASAALIFESAVVAYWTAATFTITTPPPGFASITTSIVSLFIPTALSTPLAIQFGIISSDGATTADSLAEIFNTYTTTSIQIILTGVTTSVPPVPIILNSLIL
jgi:hypothetical protein